MTSYDENKTQPSHLDTRLAVVEQNLLTLNKEQSEQGTRLERLYQYVFGGDSNPDSLVGQFKAMNARLDLLIHQTDNNMNETQKRLARLTDLEQRQEKMETWKSGLNLAAEKKDKEFSQVKFFLITSILGTTISSILVWVLGHFLK